MTSIPKTYSYNYNNDISRFKYLERVDKTPETHDSSVRAAAQKYVLRRNRLSRRETNIDKIQSFVGAVAGTAITLAVMMKKRGVVYEKMDCVRCYCTCFLGNTDSEKQKNGFR
jgi:hypothetical protein